MKVLHTADWHLGKKIDDKYCLLQEQKQVLIEIIDIAKRENPDIVIIAGDIFDKIRPSVEAQNLFYKTVKSLNNNGRTPIIIVAGNHDSPDLIEVTKPLANSYGIFLLGWPDTVIPMMTLDSKIEITASEIGFLQLKHPDYDYPFRIVFAPYINEERLKQRLTNQDSNTNTLSNVLKNTWKRLDEEYLTTRGINILVAHHFFINSKDEDYLEDDGERSIKSLGTAQVINTNILPRRLQYVALGHLHSYIQMEKPPCPCPVVYTGSPLPYSFDEQNQNKYVNIVEIEPLKKAIINTIALKSGKKLIRYKAKNVEDAKRWLADHQNCFVEISIKTQDGLLTNDKKDLNDIHPYIISIIPELILKDNIDKASALPDLTNNIESLFIEYFKNKNKGECPSSDLIQIFNEIVSAHDSD
ncbi:MAG: metallophosphoesterase family protein [Solitalea-like symbiont of Acarus siro]